MIYCIRAHLPHSSLREECDGACGTAVVWQESGHRYDDQDEVFAEGRPVQGVGRIVTGLWDQDGSAVWSELKVACIVGVDDVAFGA